MNGLIAIVAAPPPAVEGALGLTHRRLPIAMAASRPSGRGTLRIGANARRGEAPSSHADSGGGRPRVSAVEGVAAYRICF